MAVVLAVVEASDVRRRSSSAFAAARSSRDPISRAFASSLSRSASARLVLMVAEAVSAALRSASSAAAGSYLMGFRTSAGH